MYKTTLIARGLLIASLLVPAAVLAQADGESSTVPEEKLEAAIEDVKGEGSLQHGEVGEASYNVEDCRLAIEAADAGGAMKDGQEVEEKSGVKPLDLDKCRALVK